MHLIDSLSIILRCNSFVENKKAVVVQTGSRPPTSDHDHYFGASLALGSALELCLGPATELVIPWPFKPWLEIILLFLGQ